MGHDALAIFDASKDLDHLIAADSGRDHPALVLARLLLHVDHGIPTGLHNGGLRQCQRFSRIHAHLAIRIEPMQQEPTPFYQRILKLHANLCRARHRIKVRVDERDASMKDASRM